MSSLISAPDLRPRAKFGRDRCRPPARELGGWTRIECAARVVPLARRRIGRTAGRPRHHRVGPWHLVGDPGRGRLGPLAPGAATPLKRPGTITPAPGTSPDSRTTGTASPGVAANSPARIRDTRASTSARASVQLLVRPGRGQPQRRLGEVEGHPLGRAQAQRVAAGERVDRQLEALVDALLAAETRPVL